MADDAIGAAFDRLDRVEEDRVGHRRGRGVLHPAAELGHAHGGILGITVRRADHPVEELDHLRGLAHRPPGRRLVDLLQDVVIHGEVAELVAVDVELGGDDREEVGGQRLVHLPVVGRGAVRVLPRRVEHPVGDDRQRLIDRDDHLGGRALVGIIEARNPVPGVLGLADGPDDGRPVGVVGVGLDEVEPVLGRAGIGHGQFERLVGAVGAVERDVQLVPLLLELARRRTDRDFGDLQVGAGVERDGVEAGVERREGVGGRAPDLLLLGVEGQIPLDVLHVEGPDPLGLFRRPRPGKGPPRGGSSRAGRGRRLGRRRGGRRTGRVEIKEAINKTLRRMTRLPWFVPGCGPGREWHVIVPARGPSGKGLPS